MVRTNWTRLLPIGLCALTACATNALPLSGLGSGDTITDGETTTETATGQGGASGTTTSTSSSTTSTSSSSTSTTSSSSSSSTSTTSTTSSSSSTTSTGAPDCAGVYDSGIPACNACLEGSCCQELVDCNGDADCAPCLAGDPACTQSGAAFDNLVACLSNGCGLECTPPAPPGCNPVTGDPCDLAGGEACDLGSDGNGGSSFQCFPAPNDAALCAACDNTAGPFCQGGLHCDTNTCAKYCCSDADCGAGNVCDFVFAPDFAAGLCHDAVGGAAACSAPKPSPSGGACMP